MFGGFKPFAKQKVGAPVVDLACDSSGEMVAAITVSTLFTYSQRQQLAAVSANMIPYHLMTGDVSQANYSGLRAAMNGSYAMIDDWQQNEIIPMLVMPAVRRRMQRLYLETGDRRFLDVKLDYARPIRRLVDPIKDLAGEGNAHAVIRAITTLAEALGMDSLAEGVE